LIIYKKYLNFRKNRGLWKLKAVQTKKVEDEVFFNLPLIGQTISERLDRFFPNIFGVIEVWREDFLTYPLSQKKVF
jgi:hypothetical protein